MMAHTLDPSTWETEAGGSLWVWGQPGLQSKFQDRQSCYTENSVSKKQNKTNKQTEGWRDGFVFWYSRLHLLNIWQTTTNIHRTESILGCFKISSVNEINRNLFTLTSGSLLDKGKGGHFVHPDIPRMLSRPQTKSHSFWKFLSQPSNYSSQ